MKTMPMIRTDRSAEKKAGACFGALSTLYSPLTQQAGGLRRAGRRSSHRGQGENQRHRDRAHSHRRLDGLPEV